jgi:hypothetical protein
MYAQKKNAQKIIPQKYNIYHKNPNFFYIFAEENFDDI